MRTQQDLVRQLDDRFIVEHPLGYPEALRMFEAMWQEGVEGGGLPGAPWDGIVVVIPLARVLNACSRPS
jgi:hypothetical protein